ncbi:atlastin-like [Neocloeon triangulifer]|uniref:atlastin-like n=1 Tax=Neocloeon triangulifer TaxID=2078957 RepID=UPI00286F6451|nr:atlastin-like [Neocloeon triangulifer]
MDDKGKSVANVKDGDGTQTTAAAVPMQNQLSSSADYQVLSQIFQQASTVTINSINITNFLNERPAQNQNPQREETAVAPQDNFVSKPPPFATSFGSITDEPIGVAPIESENASEMTPQPACQPEVLKLSKQMNVEESVTKECAQGIARAVQVVLAKEDHTFELDEQALEDILMQDHVKDRHVVVVSVAGAFRKGKSFLLDFFLRYMKAQGNEDWLGEEESPLDGFSWRGASEKGTTGIRMWSEVFLVDLPVGEKVAVVLMETAGDFENEIAVRECAPVFALSTISSSVQVYNLSQNIRGFDLKHLQIFTEFSQLAFNYFNNPFQKLQFLIRDWSYPYEAKYGSEGGQQIFDRKLKVLAKQHPELHLLGRHITSCFKDISCFLMPHPGLQVSTNPNFDGRLKDIETDFKQHLSVLGPLLLAPDNLVIKEIGGQKVKANELFEFFIKSYTRICKGSDLPEPQPLMDRLKESALLPTGQVQFGSLEPPLLTTITVPSKQVPNASATELPDSPRDTTVDESTKMRPELYKWPVICELNRNYSYQPTYAGHSFLYHNNILDPNDPKINYLKVFRCTKYQRAGCTAYVKTDFDMTQYKEDPATTAIHTCLQEQVASEETQAEREKKLAATNNEN